MNAYPEANMSEQCAACGMGLTEVTSFCPGCGQPTGLLEISGRDRMLAGLAYLTLLPSAILLIVQPFKRDSYLRFHSIQALAYWAAGVAIGLALRVLAYALILIPTAGLLIIVLLSVALAVAWTLGLAVLTIKALQQQLFKIPWIGSLAQRFAFSGPGTSRY